MESEGLEALRDMKIAFDEGLVSRDEFEEARNLFLQSKKKTLSPQKPQSFGQGIKQGLRIAFHAFLESWSPATGGQSPKTGLLSGGGTNEERIPLLEAPPTQTPTQNGEDAKKGGPCGHCGSTESPLWRKGPDTKPVLCNPCGQRWRMKRTLDGYLPKKANPRAESDDRAEGEGEEEPRSSSGDSVLPSEVQDEVLPNHWPVKGKRSLFQDSRKPKRPKVSPEPSPEPEPEPESEPSPQPEPEPEPEVLVGKEVKVFWPKYRGNYTGRVVTGTKASSLIFYKDGTGKIRLAWPPRRWTP